MVHFLNLGETGMMRGWIIFVVMFVVLFFAFNRGQVADDVLNSSRPSADYLHFFSYGTKPFDRNEFKRAKAYYQTLLAGKFSTAAMHANLGFCYYYLKDTAKAIEQYNIAIRMDPKLYALYYDLAVIKQGQKDYAAAQELYKKAIYLIPKTKSDLLDALHINPKFRHHVMFDYYFEQRLPWDKLMAYNHLFECLVQLKSYDGILEYAASAMRIFPKDPEIFYYAAYASYNLGYIKEALAFTLRSIEVAANYAAAYELKAAIMRMIGDVESQKQDLLSFKHFQEKDGWRRNRDIEDLHHWDENTVLFQIYR